MSCRKCGRQGDCLDCCCVHPSHRMKGRGLAGYAICPACQHPLSSTERPPEPPPCESHKEVQHRDGKPPWCNACGWRHEVPAKPAQQIRKVEA